MNPLDVINYERTEAQLQEFLLFAMCVAGKNADQQGRKLDLFMETAHCSPRSNY